MEPNHGRLKFAPEDFISHMPDNVVTDILDRLPLLDAVRTDVLSKTWRLKWTMISQLVFDEDFFGYLSKTKAHYDQVRVIIGRLLFHLRGAITKFVLSIDYTVGVDDEDIRHWILFLSRKGIKDLTIMYWDNKPLKLPTYLFSCLELKHLKLANCYFRPPPNFHGFPNLLSLDLLTPLEDFIVVWEFITRGPLLEILKLNYVTSSGKIKVAEIAKLENLKILSLYLGSTDPMNKLHSFSITFELLGSLPKLQELELISMGCKLTKEGAKQRLSTAFPSLKALKLSSMCLCLDCAFKLIRSCPNLQTLKIASRVIGPPPQEDYITTGLLQLRSMIFQYSKGSENELCLLKYLLASSPFLKKFVIHFPSGSNITSDGKLKFASKLLKLQRASPVVDIKLS